MSKILRFLVWLWKAKAFSPAAFLLRAIVLTVGFVISELLGLREYTTFLSGTSANIEMSWQTASVLGCIHLLLYVAFVVLVPIALITAGILAAWERYFPAQKHVGDDSKPAAVI